MTMMVMMREKDEEEQEEEEEDMWCIQNRRCANLWSKPMQGEGASRGDE